MSIEQRRAHLVEAAIGLAEQKGVAAVTTRDVARAAGVSLGVVHYCFDSKDALITEVVKALSAELRDSVDDDPEFSGWTETGIDALRSLVTVGLAAMWRDVEDKRNRQLLTYEVTTYALREADGDPQKLGIAREQYAFNDSTVAVLFDRAATVTETKWTVPVTEVSRLVLSMIDGVVLRWLVDEDSATAYRQLERLAQLVTTLAE